MIEIINLSKSFGKLSVLKSIHIEFRDHTCVSLLGPNGSGKTTLLKCILGHVIPDSGLIKFEGQSILSEYRYRNYLGYMPQTSTFPGQMTIGQVMDMMCDLRSRAERDEDLITEYKLKSIYTKRLNTLSGGTKQKVNAALAFLFKPKVYILDEPTAGLDPLASEILKSKIRDVRTSGALILLTSHVLSDLDDLVTDLTYLNEGSIAFSSSVNKIKEETGEDKLSRAVARLMLASYYD
jgi:Cu-processing system ATP-binding protein